MQVIKAKIDAIEAKIRKLLKRNKELATVNKSLKEENIKLKKELEDIFFRANMANQHTEEVSIYSKNEKTDLLKNELDKYIEQVDDCIKILEGQS